MDPRLLLLGLLIGGVFCSLLERWAPAEPKQKSRRRGWRTDVFYGFVTPLITKPMTSLLLAVCLILSALAAGVPFSTEHLERFLTSRGAVASWPFWLQVGTFFLLADLLGYLAHRLLHAAFLWPIHAVHHSSTEVDWLSAVRVHPLNDLFARLLQAVPLVLFGFDATLLAAWVPLLVFYSLLQHANLRWDFGPLRYFLVSPAFHRWHHAATRGEACNFAGIFPVWDLLFGTYYLPRRKWPSSYGAPADAIPQGILGQMIYPLRRQLFSRSTGRGTAG